MNQWTAETQKIINANAVTAKTYDKIVMASGMGFGNYVKSLGGIFAECYGHISDPVTTVQEFHKRAEYVCGLMAIFRFCYWNGSTWWYWMNSASKAFYSSKVTNKGCRGGTIYQLCQGTDGRLRITCCNYGVDTLLKACGLYSLKKTTVKTKSKLVPGDVIDLYRKSDGKWHHQVIVHSVEGSKIWCVDFGNRFIKTGKPLHYMSLTGTTAGGEYGTDKWIGRHRTTLKKEEAIPMLNGVDIASYQAGIDFSKVPADFVIIKATEGTGYVNPDCNRAYANAKTNGKLLGLYHYANGTDPAAEADFFIKTAGSRIGDALLALDWERVNNNAFGKNDVAWVKAWLDRVYDKTGVRPLVYMSQSVTLAHDWASVAKDYGLWVAQYVVESRSGYKQDYAHGITGAWKYPAIWQYTSGGYLSGWSARLDLDVAYMSRDAWNRYAGKSEEVEIMPRTIKKGSTGAAVKVLQSALGGLTIDGKFGAKTDEKVRAFQKKKGLTIDGIVGPKTWRAVIASLA